MAIKTTMLELVKMVGESATSEAELIATVAALVNNGTFELSGNFRGQRIVLDQPACH